MALVRVQESCYKNNGHLALFLNPNADCICEEEA